ncbi:hypothetical protein J2T57_002587 [Natronocella acetinitrilica]|uniref:Uncharacterized protein n=1 Tax=Natronocella acetinitrilica TaxID=414046 RepID=A0AAE3G4X1_9GAMM|nr:hypothetical protein [Natronocella acetinitrilica]MCP1675437.1 hypothetical protein [Natronocella acetinitrilica]
MEGGFGLLLFSVIIITAIAYGLMTSQNRKHGRQRVCADCATVANPKRKPRGSMGVEIILWLLFIIPGLIYSIWRQSTYRATCPECGSDNLVPLNTPRGRKLAAEFQEHDRANDLETAAPSRRERAQAAARLNRR